MEWWTRSRGNPKGNDVVERSTNVVECIAMKPWTARGRALGERSVVEEKWAELLIQTDVGVAKHVTEGFSYARVLFPAGGVTGSPCRPRAVTLVGSHGTPVERAVPASRRGRPARPADRYRANALLDGSPCTAAGRRASTQADATTRQTPMSIAWRMEPAGMRAGSLNAAATAARRSVRAEELPQHPARIGVDEHAGAKGSRLRCVRRGHTPCRAVRRHPGGSGAGHVTPKMQRPR